MQTAGVWGGLIRFGPTVSEESAPAASLSSRNWTSMLRPSDSVPTTFAV